MNEGITQIANGSAGLQFLNASSGGLRANLRGKSFLLDKYSVEDSGLPPPVLRMGTQSRTFESDSLLVSLTSSSFLAR